MGKEFHYTIPKFLDGKFQSHSNLRAWKRVDVVDWIIYEVSRKRPLDEMKVILSDQYRFTEHDFYEMEHLLRPGDFVLVAKPEAGYTKAARMVAAERRIGVGKYADMYSALNYREVWGREPMSDNSDMAG